jgi:hypothetical protein
VSVTNTSVTGSGTAGVGIYTASTAGGISVTSGTVTETGANSFGIGALGAGNVSVTSGTINSTSTAISAASTGGAVTVTSGNISTTAAGAAGIFATGATGVTVTSTGSVTGIGRGISAGSAGGAVSIDANNVSTANDAIRISAATTSNVTIRGLVTSTGGFAISTDGGAATVGILAAGTVRGRIDLTDNADFVNNAGLFDTIGDSAFGLGFDTFNNSGTIRSLNGVVNFTGLEAFNNTGRVEMRDGAIDDRLNLGTAAFAGGANSRLGVDVNLTTTTADVLVTGAATGSTIIDVNLLSPPIFNLTGTLVVDAGAGTNGNAFTLVGGIQNYPYIRLNLLFDAPNNNFLIQALPDQPVFETVMQAEMLTNFWYNGTDAVSAQLEAARDGLVPAGAVRTNSLAGAGRLGGWVQVVGGNINRDAAQTFNNGGAATVFNTSYEQDYQGVQV